MIPKNVRIVDEELLEVIKTIPCMACGAAPPNDAHHITSRKAGGHDVAQNVISFCREHHTENHQIGVVKMFQKYPTFKTWLELAKRTDVLDKEKLLDR